MKKKGHPEAQEGRQIELFEHGTYVLVLKLTKEKTMRVGSLGRIGFRTGYYAYVGSARRGMRHRVARHLTKQKRKRWHIDWLTSQEDVVPIAVASTQRTGLECRIATALSSRAEARAKDFGCSDCECESHLCYFPDIDSLSLALNDLRRYGVSVEQASNGLRYSSQHPRL